VLSGGQAAGSSGQALPLVRAQSVQRHVKVQSAQSGKNAYGWRQKFVSCCENSVSCAVLCAVQGNVRGLLGSLQTVLWEDSGWQPFNMGDLLEPAQVCGGCWGGVVCRC
jgi:hypothetical protein